MAFRKLTDFIQADVIENQIIDTLTATNVARNVVTVTSQRELGYGSSYKIPGVGSALTVNQYAGNAITPEQLSSTYASIAIDKFPYISFLLQDSDVVESTALNSGLIYGKRAGEKIATDMDKDVFATMFTGATASATDLGATSASIQIDTGTKALDYLEKFANTLRDAGVESDGAIVIPHFVYTKVARELGVNVNNATIAGAISTNVLPNVFGFDIYAATNLPKGTAGGLLSTEYGCVGLKRSCFQVVEGLIILKSGDSEYHPATWNQFGMVYGRGVVNANGIYKGVVRK